MNWKDSIKNLNNILTNPKETASTLSRDDVELLLMETILAFLDSRLDLKTLLSVTKAIDKYSNISFSKDIHDSIQVILELESYSNNIVEILTDVLQDLLKAK